MAKEDQAAPKPETTVTPAVPNTQTGSNPSGQAAPKPETSAAPVAKAPKSTSVDILKGQNYIRTYSQEVHGDNFLELAQELVAKEGYAKRQYTIVDSSTVKKVAVLYREKEDADKPLDQQSPDAPDVDKERVFTDKDEALAFNVLKKGSVVAKPH